MTGIYTGQIQYSPSFINWHIVCLPWVAHLAVALQEEVTTFPVVIGVRGFIDNFKDGLLRDKTIHSLWFVNLIWTVAMDEFLYCQRFGTVWHGSVQDLHRYKNPLGILEYLADGQAQVLEMFAM